MRHLFTSVAAIGISSALDACNVTLTTPSVDASGALPIGNVTLGASVRVEPFTGNLMTTAQLMPQQCDGNTIRRLSVWPPGWDADFKLHAPANTVVTGTVKGGPPCPSGHHPFIATQRRSRPRSLHAAMITTRCSHPRCLPIARA